MSHQATKTRGIPVYSLDGSVKEEVNLPLVFANEVRPDLIQRAVN
jgi:ribosomal protein L4